MKPRYGRVLLKLSGEALMGEQQFGIDPAVTTRIAKDIAETLNLGDVFGDARRDGGIDAELLLAHEGFPGQLQQDPAVTRLHPDNYSEDCNLQSPIADGLG